MRMLRRWSALVVLSILVASGCKGNAEAKAKAEDGGASDTGAKGTIAAAKPELSPGEQMYEQLRLDERSFPLLIWSLHIVGVDYFDKDRFDPKAQLAVAMDYIGLSTPEFFGKREGDELEVTVRSQSQRFSLAEVDNLDAAADVMEKVLEFTAGVLSLEGEPLHELEYDAINGLLGRLDPHTILLTPEESAELGVKTRGRFGGIGAEIAASERRVLVVRVLPGSPAEAAGLLDNDVILEIDDQSTVNLSSDDARSLLRGPVETTVVLKVRRGDALKVIEITRGMISIPTISATMLPDRVGYVQVATFQEDTAEKLLAALEEFQTDGELAGLVVDLRGNSGGLLAQAVGILNQVVEGGELVIVRSALGREHQDATKEIVIPMEAPIVALVDENAASASEIVGGSLKHLDRGVVLGRASFGKGTVQELRTATPYGREVALKMTIAEYRVAGDRRIQSIGVVPDLQLLPVELSNFEGVARMYDLERFERRRERARTAHLPSAIHDVDVAADIAMSRGGLSLRYFAGGGAPETPEGGDAGPRELQDPEIRLAREVALALRGVVGRRAQLEALPKIVEGLARSEDQHIRAAIEPWKIDWSDIDDAADLDAEVGVAVSIVGDGPQVAGQPFTLHVEVQNPTERALERVHLITDCDRDELDGIELLIGKLEPGALVSRDIDLQVLPWRESFVDTLTVMAHVGEPGARPDGEARLNFAVDGAARPSFSYDYWVIDDPRLVAKGPKRPDQELIPGEEAFVVQGNGDGLLQPGERVLLGFRAYNASGVAPDARVLLRNLSGRQGLLEEGLYVHGELDAGEAFLGAFGISVSTAADPGLPLELELIVGDALLSESVDDKLRFRIIPGREGVLDVEGERRRTVAGDGPLRIYNGADGSAPIVAELGAGAVVEVSGVAGEWLALDGERGEGRRLWIPKDMVEVGGKGPVAHLAREHRMVDPPVLSLAEVPSVVTGDSVEISGVAQHHARVRDVVVTVRASGPDQPERKVFYLANRALEGEAARSLEFSTAVELSPGSNRITVLVRDHDKVERRRNLWVFQD
ncbi:Carboxy-terminal processing protease CtpB precursor [Enhygromyxa salina]|uniref:Carboxy-terminal processing protease CtpB n=1 Tax=Enhygromyxa salina TaxID=215803 RepID=A0A2S9XBQ5_9BACT|nr:MXAN_5808 family serine peptidase [Enhygromyxa salina]PRP90292.1 Carboxy-terminal processing protease CtpB precursor [Enhygromyxa salina]